MKLTKRQLRRIVEQAVAANKRDELMDAIKSKFGIKFAETTEEFGTTPGGIWLSGESGDEMPDGLPIFDYYAGEQGPFEFGVHKDFSAFIEPYGFFAEWRDPGTIMLWEM